MALLQVHPSSQPAATDWRCLRHSEAVQLDAMAPHQPFERNGHRLTDALADEQTLWRFPWPDEDLHARMLMASGVPGRKLDRTLRLPLPAAAHQAVRSVVHTPPGQTPIEGAMPPAVDSALDAPAPTCPLGRPAEVDIALGPPANAAVAELAGCRVIDKQPTTILRCPHCGVLFALDEPLLARIAQCLRTAPLTGWIAHWFELVAQRLLVPR